MIFIACVLANTWNLADLIGVILVGLKGQTQGFKYLQREW